MMISLHVVEESLIKTQCSGNTADETNCVALFRSQIICFMSIKHQSHASFTISPHFQSNIDIMISRRWITSDTSWLVKATSCRERVVNCIKLICLNPGHNCVVTTRRGNFKFHPPGAGGYPGYSGYSGLDCMLQQIVASTHAWVEHLSSKLFIIFACKEKILASKKC